MPGSTPGCAPTRDSPIDARWGRSPTRPWSCGTPTSLRGVGWIASRAWCDRVQIDTGHLEAEARCLHPCRSTTHEAVQQLEVLEVPRLVVVGRSPACHPNGMMNPDRLGLAMQLLGGVTQGERSRISGVSPTTISPFLHGKRELRPALASGSSRGWSGCSSARGRAATPRSSPTGAD